MRKIVFLMIIGMALFGKVGFTAANPEASKDTGTVMPAEQDKLPSEVDLKSEKHYMCPMCPGVHDTKPGKCPQCGMDLMLATTDEDTKTHETESEPLKMEKE